MVHSSEWQRWMKALKLEIIDQYRFQVWRRLIPKIPKFSTWTAFPLKIHLVFSLWFTRNVIAFELSAKCFFPASCDLKTAKLSL